MDNVYKRVGVVTGFVLLLLVVAFNSVVIRQHLAIQVENQAWLLHSFQVRSELDQIQSLITDAETGQRGYLYTGDPRYLEPYQFAASQINAHIDTFAQLTSDNPRQQARVPQLRALARQKLDLVAQTIALQQDGSPAEARALVLSDKGLILMTDLRSLIDAMRQEESSLQTVRLATYSHSVHVTVLCVYLANAVAGLGLVLLAFYILRQITLRDRHAAQLAESQEWFRVTLSSIGDAVIATDAQGRVIFLNPIAEKLLGRDIQYARNRPITEVFPIFNETSGLPVENPISKVIEFGNIVGLANHTLLERSDGVMTPIEDSAAPIRDRLNRIVGMVLVFRDATYERKSQEVLRKAEKLASAARLAATVSHEVNNPLEAVGNLLFIARTTPGIPVSAQENLALAEQELERVSHITRQTLGFFRESTARQDIDLPSVVDSVLRIYSSKLRNKYITVERFFDPCPPIHGMAGELTQVISNLVANAADAVAVGGTIRVRLGCVEGEEPATVRVSIEDNGSGIAPEHLNSIFEPFFTTKKDVGTGLGLFVAKEIVERHGGSIQVHSQNSNGSPGSVFKIHLPVPVAPRPAANEYGARE